VGHRKTHGFAGNHGVRRIGELDEDAVRAGRQADDDQGLAAGVDEVPRSVVYGDMNMANARGHCECTGAEDGYQAQVLCAVLNEDATLGKGLCQRRVDNQPGGWLVFGSPVCIQT